MGMIYGQYDAKEQKKGEQGFVPGGSSIHACMYVTLCYAMICYVMSCYVMVYYVMLCYVI